MVVLTIVTQNNGETFYFDEPIPQVHFMRLVSCSLYNSWHNLKTVGLLTIRQTGEPVASIPEGNYNAMSLAKELMESYKYLKSSSAKIIKIISTNTPNSVMKIQTSLAKPVIQQQGSLALKPNPNKEISVSHTLARFIGVGTQLPEVSYQKAKHTVRLLYSL